MKSLWIRIQAALSKAPVAIIIENGKAKKIRGNVSNGLLAKFSEVARSEKVRSGLVTVIQIENEKRIQFSGISNDTTQQKFRNVWFSQPERKLTYI